MAGTYICSASSDLSLYANIGVAFTLIYYVYDIM